MYIVLESINDNTYLNSFLKCGCGSLILENFIFVILLSLLYNNTNIFQRYLGVKFVLFIHVYTICVCMLYQLSICTCVCAHKFLF